MKNMKTKMTLAIVTALTVGITGCRKDEDPPTPTPTTGTFNLGIGFHWGANDFDMAQTYTDGAGNAIMFTAIKFYLSDFHLENNGATVGDFHGKTLLLSAVEEGTYTIGSMNPASADELGLSLGLDSAANHADPTQAAAPLNDPDMHWAWNPAAGYKFLVVEGRVDNDGTGIVESDDPVFAYHCATDDALRGVNLPATVTFTAGSISYLHLHVGVGSLLDGVNTLTTPDGMGYEPVNAALLDNLVAGMEIE